MPLEIDKTFLAVPFALKQKREEGFAEEDLREDVGIESGVEVLGEFLWCRVGEEVSGAVEHVEGRDAGVVADEVVECAAGDKFSVLGGFLERGVVG